MHILVCSDIFGSTTYLKKLLEEVTFSKPHISFIDPYQGSQHSFKNEAEAYEQFTSLGGINAYIDKVALAISQQKNDFIVLGFSAGGAAAWKVLSAPDNQAFNELIAFYPGQIRHYIDAHPQCKTRLVFAVEEAHSDVQKIHQTLSTYPLVTSHISSYQHGFMNPLSSGFSQQGYNNYVVQLQHWINITANGSAI